MTFHGHIQFYLLMQKYQPGTTRLMIHSGGALTFGAALCGHQPVN